MADELRPETTGDYRLGRVEREVAELRSKIESGQGAMLQAVAGVQTQLAAFQISLQNDLMTKFLPRHESDDYRREMRERLEEHSRRLDAADAIYIKTLDEARKIAETKRADDAERTLRVNLALVGAVLSAAVSIGVHFIKF
jgi:hypothetical protein